MKTEADAEHVVPWDYPSGNVIRNDRASALLNETAPLGSRTGFLSAPINRQAPQFVEGSRTTPFSEKRPKDVERSDLGG